MPQNTYFFVLAALGVGSQRAPTRHMLRDRTRRPHNSGLNGKCQPSEGLPATNKTLKKFWQNLALRYLKHSLGTALEQLRR